MELRILNTFLKVAQLQSFSKAADSLGYSQSAITVQVQQLENELGVRLFDRIGKNVTITHYGQSFIPYARDVISSATKAAHFAVDDHDLTGTLRIGSIESIITTSFSEILPLFHQRCPHVKTTIYSGGTQELLEMLHHNELDLIYTLDEPGYDPQLIKLFEQPEEVVVMAGGQHPLSKSEHLMLKDIIHEDFILMPKTSNYRHLFDAELARQKLEVHPFLELDGTDMAIRLLENNPYLTVLPRYAAEAQVQSGSIVLLPVEDCHMEQYRQLVHHKDKVITPQIRAIADVIAANAGVELTTPEN